MNRSARMRKYWNSYQVPNDWWDNLTKKRREKEKTESEHKDGL